MVICSICWSDNNLFELKKCKHLHCKYCIQKIIKNNNIRCSICRTDNPILSVYFKRDIRFIINNFIICIWKNIIYYVLFIYFYLLLFFNNY